MFIGISGVSGDFDYDGFSRNCMGLHKVSKGFRGFGGAPGKGSGVSEYQIIF